MLWDFSVQADHKLKYGKSDMLIFHKYVGECPKIVAAFSCNTREKEKIQDKVK